MELQSVCHGDRKHESADDQARIVLFVFVVAAWTASLGFVQSTGHIEDDR